MTKKLEYQISLDDLYRAFDSQPGGLSSTQAKERLNKHGLNELPETKSKGFWRFLIGQFADFMIIVLLSAAFIAGVLGEMIDTIAILVIVLINALMGATQSYRAEQAIAALKRMSTPHTSVYRDGQLTQSMAQTLVPGDIVQLEAGNLVPADLRLLDVDDLQTDESTLTGESAPVTKDPSFESNTEIPISERSNMLFSGSSVTRGRATAIVVHTGLNTELGKIARLLQATGDQDTPLQVRLAAFGKYLAIAVIAICLVVFVAGLMQGQEITLMFLTSVSLAVAAIPEALPAVIAISLALGARKLLKLKALVRNLPAVETLGSVTYICTDKTGTLTQNRMTMEKLVVNGRLIDAAASIPDQVLTILALSNDVMQAEKGPVGEPTELALYNGALNHGVDKFTLEKQLSRLDAIPFDSVRKRMSTFHQKDHQVLMLCKGATESILDCCTHALEDGQATPIDRQKYLNIANGIASKGYRVLALAQRTLSNLPENLTQQDLESDLCLVGLIALIDPLRPEVKRAVKECADAGISTVMITGDHPATASAIATDLGWLNDQSQVLNGQALSGLEPEIFDQQVRNAKVFARVSPEQKLTIVQSLRQQGEFVAMTGDGVNDAPALQAADIGVAMGLRGTDVARQASDMVLLDDNFATIVNAVKSGRRIFDNIRNFVKDTMSSNSGEIWTLFLAPFFGLPIPLLPLHILWINLVTDGLPGLAFSAEPAEPGVMRRRPRAPSESIFAHGMWQHIVWVGLFVAFISLGAMIWAIQTERQSWQTIVFTVLTLSQLFHSFAVRSEKESVFSIGLLANRPMLFALTCAFILQLCVIYMPYMNRLFSTQPLPLIDLLICIGLSSSVLFAVEIEKWMARKDLIYQSTPLHLTD